MHSSTSSARFRIVILLGFYALVFAVETFQRANLVDKIPFVLTLFGATLGGLLGYWVATQMLKEERQRRSLWSKLPIITIPLFSLFAGTFAARSLFVGLAFVGLDTSPSEAKLMVESRATRCADDDARHCRVNIVLEDGSRVFRVLVSDKLYSAIGPNPSSGTHCIMLEVETGRLGYRRVLAPNYFDKPLGMADYEPC